MQYQLPTWYIQAREEGCTFKEKLYMPISAHKKSILLSKQLILDPVVFIGK